MGREFRDGPRYPEACLEAAVPNLFGTRDQFVEDNSQTGGGRDGLGMIQVHYIYCELYLITIISAPPQIIGHEILEVGDPWSRGNQCRF